MPRITCGRCARCCNGTNLGITWSRPAKPTRCASSVSLAFSEARLDRRDHVVTDQSLLRPAEVEMLVGDASDARRDLDWIPTVGFAEPVRIMVNADMALVGRELERMRPDGQLTTSRQP